jgi:hypothetical protein
MAKNDDDVFYSSSSSSNRAGVFTSTTITTTAPGETHRRVIQEHLLLECQYCKAQLLRTMDNAAALSASFFAK